MRPARSLVASLAVATAIGCGDAPTGPSLSLVGTWDVIGFEDRGVAADVEGNAVFTGYGTYRFEIERLAFPGEPPDRFTAFGAYEANGDRLSLYGSSGVDAHYRLVPDADRMLLRALGRDPPTVITLRSTSR